MVAEDSNETVLETETNTFSALYGGGASAKSETPSTLASTTTTTSDADALSPNTGGTTRVGSRFRSSPSRNWRIRQMNSSQLYDWMEQMGALEETLKALQLHGMDGSELVCCLNSEKRKEEDRQITIDQLKLTNSPLTRMRIYSQGLRAKSLKKIGASESRRSLSWRPTQDLKIGASESKRSLSWQPTQDLKIGASDSKSSLSWQPTQARRQAIKQGVKQSSKTSSDPARRQAIKQDVKRPSKTSSDQARRQAIMQGVKRSSKTSSEQARRQATRREQEGVVSWRTFIRYDMPVFYVIVSIYLLNPDDIYTITLYDVWLDTHQISE